MTKADYIEALALESEGVFDIAAITEWPTMEFDLLEYDVNGTRKLQSEVYVFYDDSTFDCYTVVIKTYDWDGNIESVENYGMSENPFSPVGFNQYVGDDVEMGLYLGRPLERNEVPADVELAIRDRIEVTYEYGKIEILD